MSKHNEIGVKGEQIAAEFLQKKGYIIVHRNWRTGRREVDVIATKDDMLVMVEIKTRSGIAFGYPEEAVDRKKQAFLREAASVFFLENPQYRNIRFDVISLLVQRDVVKEIVHFEAAFY